MIRRKNQKNIILKVLDDQRVVVSCSKYTLQRTVKSFVLKQASWIVEKLKSSKNKKELSLDTEVLYLGKKYVLSKLINKHEFLEKELDLFYKDEAKKVIEPMVLEYAEKMQLSPQKVSFRKVKTRWGSCSFQNNISFNTELMKFNKNVVEYVVVHEIAHIKHKNHSSSFWELVEQYVPNYKEVRKELRGHI